jgi:hypothetical protein
MYDISLYRQHVPHHPFFLLKSFLGSLKLHYEGYVWLAPVKIFMKIFRLFDY